MKLAEQIEAIPVALDKIRRLAQAIRSSEEGCTEALIFLFETQPQEIWEMANRDRILESQEWAACLMILKHWKAFNHE